jgi:hypothetical protein
LIETRPGCRRNRAVNEGFKRKRMRQPPTERDQLKRGLVSQLKGSHARFVVIVAAVLPAHASLTEALANRKVRDHTSHLARGWKAERDFGHGWRWDPSVGFYEGPFWGRKSKGYFRCFDPGYDWHSCPYDGCWQRGLQGGLASGIVGPDMDALSHASSTKS